MKDTEKYIKNEDKIINEKLNILKVINFMEKNNISQSDLAERLGISVKLINKFLHGQLITI